MSGSWYSLVRQVVIFTVAFSMLGLQGMLSHDLKFLDIRSAWANPAPCVTHGLSGSCSEYWTPAGPSMGTLQEPIIDAAQQFLCLQQLPPCIDLTDTPLSSSIVPPLISSPNFYVTSPMSAHEYSEIQFLLANNFWGVDFQFGNNNTGTFPDCGTQIRQGIAHLVDKISFTNKQGNIAGLAQPIDNPLPLNNGGLQTPNACAWYKSFPETGAGCVVGASSGTSPTTPLTGGTAYHLATATGVNFVW